MKQIRRFLIAFLAITGAVALATGMLGVEFGHKDFWNFHGFFFLFFITLFPRLTLLFSSVATGGLLWWLGWLLAPRLLVAVLATLAYWNQNPVLVVIAWLVAFGGESSEKFAVVHRSRTYWDHREGFKTAKWVDVETQDRPSKK